LSGIINKRLNLLFFRVLHFILLIQIGAGGPVSYKNPDGSWTAIGVMAECERKLYPIAHIRIKYYLDWIQSVKSGTATCIAPPYITLPPVKK
jgi:hypothetical protein